MPGSTTSCIARSELAASELPWSGRSHGAAPHRAARLRERSRSGNRRGNEAPVPCNVSNEIYNRTHESERPFYLYFSPHALHTTRLAPPGTEAHYTTGGIAPTRPDSQPIGFWGALEEIDAAVGRILDTVSGYCAHPTLDPTDYEGFGKPCAATETRAARDCLDDGFCVTDLAERTLVLFTTDQGHTSAGFGIPSLREGKKTVYEGGIRTGLLAWGPGLDIGSGMDVVDQRDQKNLGSHVDLFATTVHAAGCKPGSDGRFPAVRACTRSSRKFCDTNTDCVDVSDSICEERLMLSRSLLPVLSDTVAQYSGWEGREAVFAQYSNAGKTVVTREGSMGVSVCGWRSQAGATATAIARERWGGSCEVCTTNGDCGGEMCTLNGRFCVPADLVGACADGLSGCDNVMLYSRCSGNSECATGDKCVPIRQPCTECMPGSWKLRGSGGDDNQPISAGEVKELFELNTNPEEDESLNCHVAVEGVSPAAGTLAYVQRTLREHLNDWWDCVKDENGDQTVDCEGVLP